MWTMNMGQNKEEICDVCVNLQRQKRFTCGSVRTATFTQPVEYPLSFRICKQKKLLVHQHTHPRTYLYASLLILYVYIHMRSLGSQPHLTKNIKVLETRQLASNRDKILTTALIACYLNSCPPTSLLNGQSPHQ